MAFGITNSGFVIKRLQDILTAQRAEAVALFQDLVEPGEIVDTSDSSVLGRLIGLDSIGDAELWELAQLSYSSLDPNSATGVALDNLVQYSGISRFPASPTTAIALFAGDINTLIAAGNSVQASDTRKTFTVSDSIALSPSVARGVTVTVQTVQNSTAYTINYTPVNGSLATVTFTSDSDATVAEILAGLQALIAGSHPLLTASVVGTTLVVDMTDDFQSATFSITSNLAISKCRKLGTVVCIENGPNEQDANTINTILTPVLGWDSVTNILAASAGRLLETDEELRLRFRNTKFERASNILDSLYAALLNVDGVEEVAIHENDTNVTDANGVPPHSFLPVVLGGSSQLIAEAIWLNKPMGISSQGNTVISITDSQGFPHDIGLERPNPVTVYVELTINTAAESNFVFPGNGVDLIKDAILAYAKDNFGVGDDVIYSRLYTPINSVEGFQIDSLFIGTSPAPVGVANIPVAFNEISSFEALNISVTVL
jgi:uncharacterized phage protein gp47/JayE